MNSQLQAKAKAQCAESDKSTSEIEKRGIKQEQKQNDATTLSGVRHILGRDGHFLQREVADQTNTVG